MSDKEKKAEVMFDAMLDYMAYRLKYASQDPEMPLHPSELKEIRTFLADQGITCLGSQNKKAKTLASSLPVNVTQLKSKTGK